MFTSDMFTATQWASAEEKARFANHYVKFVTDGFKQSQFTKWFYNHLANRFGHIAHHDKAGFYEEWFSTPERQEEFIKNALDWPCYGEATWTFSDVEKQLKRWLLNSLVV